MVNIYDFTNPAQYLSAVWNDKKEKNPLFSIRAWSKQLGFSNHTIIYEIVKEKRNISTRYISLIAENLKLTPEQRSYFEALIHLQKAKEEKEIRYCQERVKKLQEIGLIKFSEPEFYSPFKNPLQVVIIEYVRSPSFNGTIQDLNSKILLPHTLEEITQAVDELVQLNYLELDPIRIKSEDDYIRSSQDVPSLMIKQFHQKMLRAASDQIMQQKIDEGEYNSFFINLNKKDIPKAKQMIRNFINSFMQEMEASEHPANETYCLGIQHFALTNSNKN